MCSDILCRRNNGLYGPGAYVLANSLVTIPFLFGCSVLFTVIWQVFPVITNSDADYFWEIVTGR